MYDFYFFAIITSMENSLTISNANNELGFLKNAPAEVIWFENLRSHNTKRTHAASLKQFCEFLTITSFDQLRQVEALHVIKYRDWLKSRGLSAATINTRLATLSSIYKELIEQQVLKINPVYGVRRMAKEYHKVKSRRLSADEANRMIRVPDTSTVIGARNKLILSLLFNAGVRIGTISNLRGKDVYEEDGYLVLNLPLKGGKREQLAVNSLIQACLKQYMEMMNYYSTNAYGNMILSIPPDYPLFPQMSSNPNKNSPSVAMTEYAVNRMWHKCAEKADVVGSHPHCARTTFATTALENGADLRNVKRSLGHNQIATTESYNHEGINHAKSASFSVSFGG